MAPAVRSRAFACLAALTALALMPVAHPVHAETTEYDTPSKLPVPRWAMLRKNEVYARSGPSKDNPVKWTYKIAGLPVQIISETRDWRLICDPSGGVAWVSKTMLQSQKTVINGNNGQRLEMRLSPGDAGPVTAYLKPRAMAQLGKCKKDWCKVSAGGSSGWVPVSALWGMQTAPVCQRPALFAGN